MGFRNPFRIGVDPKTNTLYVADYGPDADAANPNRGPEGTVEWNIVKRRATTAGRTATAANYAYNDCDFPTGAARAEVRLRRTGQQLAQQHRPDEPAAGDRPRRLRLRRQPALPGDRRRRRADGRPGLPVRRRAPRRTASGRRTTTARRCSASGTRTRCTQVHLDGRAPGRHQPAADVDDVHPADGHGVRPRRRALPDRVGHRLRRQQRRLRRLPHRLHRRPGAPIAKAAGTPTTGAGAAGRAVLQRRVRATRTAARSPTPGRSATAARRPRPTRRTPTPRTATTPPT